MLSKKEINAVIGVCYEGTKTLYVKRSANMENYPGVWSLFSIQFDPDELTDHLDLSNVQRLMSKMSEQRLGNIHTKVKGYISSTVCTENPINSIVKLHLYSIAFEESPLLNPEYYSDMAWLTGDEYLDKRGDRTCGSCMRMWSDYCVKQGIADTPFAPPLDYDEF